MKKYASATSAASRRPTPTPARKCRRTKLPRPATGAAAASALAATGNGRASSARTIDAASNGAAARVDRRGGCSGRSARAARASSGSTRASSGVTVRAPGAPPASTGSVTSLMCATAGTTSFLLPLPRVSLRTHGPHRRSRPTQRASCAGCYRRLLARITSRARATASVSCGSTGGGRPFEMAA